jgi:hypothetical protein
MAVPFNFKQKKKEKLPLTTALTLNPKRKIQNYNNVSYFEISFNFTELQHEYSLTMRKSDFAKSSMLVCGPDLIERNGFVNPFQTRQNALEFDECIGILPSLGGIN